MLVLCQGDFFTLEIESLLSQIHKLPPASLFLLVIGFAIAKLPHFILQKDKAAIEARDTLIKILQQQIMDLQAEIKELKRERDDDSEDEK